MAEKRKVDRRIQRTRILLRDALMRLVEQKGYDEITIQDIADEANVARTTFYLHFKDKDELLFDTMREMYDALYEQVQASNLKCLTNTAQCDDTDFRHVSEHAEFYRILFSERGSAAFMVQVQRYLAESIMKTILPEIEQVEGQPRIPVEIMAHAYAGAQIGVMKWWLDNEQPYSSEEMACMVESLLVQGMVWAYGLTEAWQPNTAD